MFMESVYMLPYMERRILHIIIKVKDPEKMRLFKDNVIEPNIITWAHERNSITITVLEDWERGHKPKNVRHLKQASNGPRITTKRKWGCQSYNHEALNSANNTNEQKTDFPAFQGLQEEAEPLQNLYCSLVRTVTDFRPTDYISITLTISLSILWLVSAATEN
jgi:hypothetical protein